MSGFPEWLPEQKLVEQRLLDVIREEFERFGFTPIETAAIERKEVLAAKGVVEKEIYACLGWPPARAMMAATRWRCIST